MGADKLTEHLAELLSAPWVWREAQGEDGVIEATVKSEQSLTCLLYTSDAADD